MDGGGLSKFARMWSQSYTWNSFCIDCMRSDGSVSKQRDYLYWFGEKSVS
jgi:hypothetical protein